MSVQPQSWAILAVVPKKSLRDLQSQTLGSWLSPEPPADQRVSCPEQRSTSTIACTCVTQHTLPCPTGATHSLGDGIPAPTGGPLPPASGDAAGVGRAVLSCLAPGRDMAAAGSCRALLLCLAPWEPHFVFLGVSPDIGAGLTGMDVEAREDLCTRQCLTATHDHMLMSTPALVVSCQRQDRQAAPLGALASVCSESGSC